MFLVNYFHDKNINEWREASKVIYKDGAFYLHTRNGNVDIIKTLGLAHPADVDIWYNGQCVERYHFPAKDTAPDA